MRKKNKSKTGFKPALLCFVRTEYSLLASHFSLKSCLYLGGDKMLNFNSLERGCSLEKLSENILSPIEMLTQQVGATQNYYAGLSKYVNDFLLPYLASTHYFAGVEKMKLMNTSPLESLQSYMELMGFNMDVSNRFFTGSMRAVNEYNNKELQNALSAWFNTVFGLEGEDIKGFMSRQAKMIDAVANVYPQAIRDVEPDF